MVHYMVDKMYSELPPLTLTMSVRVGGVDPSADHECLFTQRYTDRDSLVRLWVKAG